MHLFSFLFLSFQSISFTLRCMNVVKVSSLPSFCGYSLSLVSQSAKSIQQACKEKWASHKGSIVTCCHIILITQQQSRVCPLSCSLCFSLLLWGRAPTATWADSHYVVWHCRACHTGQSPQRCRWVNWFLAQRRTFRLQYRKKRFLWFWNTETNVFPSYHSLNDFLSLNAIQFFFFFFLNIILGWLGFCVS